MLSQELEAAKREVVTDRLSISLNELISLYESGDVLINPTFQRLFRWGISQQSDLIESLLIGIPLPPIFFYETATAQWELIDGLQRCSTLLKFVGVLKDPDGEGLLPPTALSKTRYLPSLKNCVWEKKSDIEGIPLEDQVELSAAEKLFLRRARINVEILKQPSDAKSKFDLFQRLNRGGSVANDQEVRTCIMVMQAPEYSQKIIDFAGDQRIITLCRVSEEGQKRQQNLEYLIRLICHTYYEFGEREDLNEFLDSRIMQTIQDRSVEDVLSHISEVLQIILEAGGDDALIPSSGPSVRRMFTLRGLESILVGVSRNLQEIKKLPDSKNFVSERLAGFWQSDDAKIFSSSGSRAADRVKKTVPFGVKWFDPTHSVN